MKKLICLLFAISVATLLSAKELPKEPSVITGKLENGFTYEIKQNSKPKEIAEFRLVVKAGSLEEDDDQKGLAHFVEHMAFNGSKNFKKNELIQYLESIGVSFGSHLNASTSYERTLYQLSVPVRNNNLEKSFLIFKDWADGLVFDKEAFEAERGVILEEARSRDTVNYRLFRKTKDMKYANSKYLEREPIGDLDIVRNVPVQRAIDFYNDWYRPNLMHFVAVGDFNTTKIESLIKEYFSELTNRSTRQPASRSIPENNSTRIRIVTDPETTSNFLDITFIENLDKLKTEKDLRQSLVESMMTALFNMKASEQILKANTKAKRIYMRGMAIGESRGGYKFVAHYNGLDELAALNELYALIWSFDKHGFSDGDLALIKKRLSSANESRYKRIKSQKSSTIASALANAYLSGSTYVDYEVLYSLHKRFIDEIALADINNKFKKIVALQDKAIIFVNSTGNQVAKRKILSTIKEARKNIENFSLEKELPTKLLFNTLVPKKMMKKQYHKKFDYHEYLLANGIRVAFKQMDYNKRRIEMKGFSEGGISVYELNDLNDSRSASR
ncbi:MAG: insulinase family protein, partial [Sulfurovum sp.]|nr:insulinase family protein [Sulfurovum sp.]